MTMTVREFRPSDAEATADVEQAYLPYLVVTPRLVAWQAASTPAAQRYRRFVAEDDGQIVGTARTGVFFDSSEPGRGFANLGMHPAHRGRGGGSLLLSAAEEYLASIGTRTIFSWVDDTEASLAFASRLGYRPGQPARFQRLDLTRPLPPLTAPPDGVQLRPAADFADDPRPLYEADVEAAADEPGDVPADAMDYEEWLTLTWHRPDFDPELTSVAMVDGIVAAFSLAQTDGRRRYWSGMTGSRRVYRGRGLAKLAKAHSLHRARGAGYTEAYTNNHTNNAPMLAINTWLGYELCATEWRYIRNLAR